VADVVVLEVLVAVDVLVDVVVDVTVVLLVTVTVDVLRANMLLNVIWRASTMGDWTWKSSSTLFKNPLRKSDNCDPWMG